MSQSLTVQTIILERKKKIAKLEKTLNRTETPSMVINLKEAITEMKKDLKYFTGVLD